MQRILKHTEIATLVSLVLLFVFAPIPSSASGTLIEADVSMEESVSIDDAMNTLFGPKRRAIAYRDYTALRSSPSLPSMWPLYKQQPALAQGDFREVQPESAPTFIEVTSASSGAPSAPRSSEPIAQDNAQQALTDSSQSQASVNTPQSQTPKSNLGIIEPEPLDAPPPPSSNPPSVQADLPNNDTVPTAPSPTLPPWLIPKEGGGVVL